MPYCQECGSYLEQDANTCSSCGNKLIDLLQTGATPFKGETGANLVESAGNVTPPLDALEKSQDTDGAPEDAVETIKEQGQLVRGPEFNEVFTENPSEFISQEGISIGSHWNQAQSHLGKGLIKPVTIENCMDGYHFKYDEPPRQITKPEPHQENIVEFRFSGEPEPSEDFEKVQGPDDEEKVNPEILDVTGVKLEQEEPQVEAEPIVGPESEGESNLEDNLEGHDPIKDEQEEITPVEEGGLPEDDLIPGIDDLGPEIHTVTEQEILWEGHRSWYGLTLKEEYRITDQSVVLVSDVGQILKEVEWRSVSKIELKQNWLSKFLNIGNLELTDINSEPLLILEGIDHPERLQKNLVEMISPKV